MAGGKVAPEKKLEKDEKRVMGGERLIAIQEVISEISAESGGDEPC